VIDLLSPAALDNYWNRNVEPLIKAIGPVRIVVPAESVVSSLHPTLRC
jgi:hypothetical protein